MVGPSILLFVVLTAPPNVTVTTSAGTEIQGTWQSITSDALVIGGSNPPATIPLADLLVLRSANRATLRRDMAAQVMLQDGTLFNATSITTGTKKDSVDVVPLGGGETIPLPLKAFRWIRFGSSIGEIAAQWERLIASDTPTDLLIIRRSTGALDQAPGIVLGVEKELVRFDLDGQSIEAPKEKLEGIVFKTVTAKSTPVQYEIADSHGAVWRCSSIAPAEEQTLELKTPSGILRKLEFSKIERLSAEGNLIFLADQTPVNSSFEPDFKLPVRKALIGAWLGPGKVSARDLRLTAPCRIEYRIPEGFQRFQATVVPDPEVVAGGGCELIVSTDGTEIQRFTIALQSEPIRLALDLDKRRRLSFELKPGDGGSYGDWLLVKEARFLP